jgi:hypothetical protein
MKNEYSDYEKELIGEYVIRYVNQIDPVAALKKMYIEVEFERINIDLENLFQMTCKYLKKDPEVIRSSSRKNAKIRTIFYILSIMLKDPDAGLKLQNDEKASIKNGLAIEIAKIVNRKRSSISINMIESI